MNLFAFKMFVRNAERTPILKCIQRIIILASIYIWGFEANENVKMFSFFFNKGRLIKQSNEKKKHILFQLFYCLFAFSQSSGRLGILTLIFLWAVLCIFCAPMNYAVGAVILRLIAVVYGNSCYFQYY